jgi:hypothetical protein
VVQIHEEDFRVGTEELISMSDKSKVFVPDFLAILEAADGKIGNTSLRAALGWNESLYESVKVTLIADGSIESGKGRGGSVKLAGRT